MSAYPRHRRPGGRPRAGVRTRILRAHVLVHPGRIEGGANVVEACAATPVVIASEIDGKRGVPGPDHPGTVPVGDATSLADRLARLRDDPAMLPFLERPCAARAPGLRPARESATLPALAVRVLHPPSPSGLPP